MTDLYNSTTKTTLWFGDGGGPHSDQEMANGHRDVFGFDLSHIGVPVSIILLVLLVLCMIIAYAKARRRQANRQRCPTIDPPPISISGGVPMSKYDLYGYTFINNSVPMFVINFFRFYDILRS